MNGASYEATVLNGLIRLPENLHLPDNAKVIVVVPPEEPAPICISSPRLVHQEQVADFQLIVQENADAGV